MNFTTDDLCHNLFLSNKVVLNLEIGGSFLGTNGDENRRIGGYRFIPFITHTQTGYKGWIFTSAGGLINAQKDRY